MASFFYNKAAAALADSGHAQHFDPVTGLKIMLVNGTYTPNRDDDFVDAGGASDAVDAEITATNYTRGWGGAGRKAVTLTVIESDANDRASWAIADLTWTALGGATNDTVVGAILIKEGGANDTTSLLIAYFDLTDFTTTGVAFVLDFDAAGNIRFNT